MAEGTLPSERAERRLTAILAADTAGYSRLMGADEEDTLSRLNALRLALIDPKISKRRGRIVKTTGDGILVEFASMVDAIRCATDAERGMIERNAAVLFNDRIEFRIGINLGDIIIDGGNIFGDGVNEAARLEAPAQPGGICVSGRVQEDPQGKLDVVFDDDGEQTLKNIPRPAHGYRVRMSSGPAGSALAPALPDKPSIAVLPFQNVSGDSAQDYFADGIVEDVITGLSRFKWLFVIARNSTVVYKGQAVDVKKIGRELGVRYVLEGSVRKAGNRVRFTGQLIDAATGAYVWADHYDGVLDDIFVLQDQITASVIGMVEPHLRQAEIERAKRYRPDSLDAYDPFLHALPHAYANTPADGQQTLTLLGEALRLRPTYGSAHGLAAWCHEQFYRTGNRDENRAPALRYATASIAHGADDAATLTMAGFALSAVGRDHEAAINAIGRALALNVSYATGFSFSALVRALADQYDMAIEHASQAIRLNPLDPMGATVAMPYTALVLANLPLGRYEDAAAAAAKAVQLNSKFSITQAVNIIALVTLGRMQFARAVADQLLELMPEFKIQMLTQLPSTHPEILTVWAEALRSEGVPG